MKRNLMFLLCAAVACLAAKKGDYVDVCDCSGSTNCGKYKLASDKMTSLYESLFSSKGKVCKDDFFTVWNFSGDSVSVAVQVTEKNKQQMKKFPITNLQELKVYEAYGVEYNKIRENNSKCLSMGRDKLECRIAYSTGISEIYNKFLSSFNSSKAEENNSYVPEESGQNNKPKEELKENGPVVEISKDAIANVENFLKTKLRQNVTCKTDESFQLKCSQKGKTEPVIAMIDFLDNGSSETNRGRGVIYADVKEKRFGENLNCPHFQQATFDVENGAVEGVVVDYYPTESCESFLYTKRYSLYESNKLRSYVDYAICSGDNAICEEFGGSMPFYKMENGDHFWNYKCSDNSVEMAYCWDYVMSNNTLVQQDKQRNDVHREATFRNGKVKTLEIRNEASVYSFDFTKGLDCELQESSESFKGTCSYEKASGNEDVKDNDGSLIVSGDALNVFWGMGRRKTGKIKSFDHSLEYSIENGQRISGKEYYDSGETRVVYGRGSEVRYYKNGNKSSEVKGDCSNKCSVREYFENGSPHKEYSKSNGLKSGKEVIYYSDGKKCMETVRLRGTNVGTLKVTRSDGSPVGILQFNKDGQLHGVQKVYGNKSYYYSDGGVYLALEANFSKGELNGAFTEYYRNGKRKMSLKYKNGDPVSEKVCYKEDGSVKKTGLAHMDCGDDYDISAFSKVERFCN
ncbi:MAG: hypothetical protein MJY98_07530 [Fibrobacter sp.]|nr:hypothetical protein [Fibrobacter sp.]